MIIVGLAGLSGSGKTTMAKTLSKSFDSEIIHVDDIVKQIAFDNKLSAVLSKALGIKVLNESGNLSGNYLFGFICGHMIHILPLSVPALQILDKKVNDIIKNSNKQIAIVDFKHLPMMTIWDKCDIKCLITADEKVRFEHIAGRSESAEYATVKSKETFNYKKYKFDMVLQNNDSQTLNDSVKLLSDKINTLIPAASPLSQI